MVVGVVQSHTFMGFSVPQLAIGLCDRMVYGLSLVFYKWLSREKFPFHILNGIGNLAGFFSSSLMYFLFLFSNISYPPFRYTLLPSTIKNYTN